MSWSQSLIKLASYEVEVLQKRLSEVAARRTEAELRLAMLTAEGEAEAEHARGDAEAGLQHIGFLDGLRRRKTEASARIEALKAEEAGARDALALAFETQKKYEQVAETAQRLERKEAGRRETAAMDEMGLRRLAGR